MRHLNRFINNIKFFINHALAEDGVSPDIVSRKILTALTAEKNSDRAEREFINFISERDISQLVHFTHIKNLPSILSYGLIPRLYLEEEVIKIAVGPVFSDEQRQDGITEASCLSISFPNYRMFYSKSAHNQESWTVLCLDSEVLVKHACRFSEANNARSDSVLLEGIEGARRLFGNPDLRSKLGLPDSYATHPEAEVLELSVIPPRWIKEVHVYSQGALGRYQRIAEKAGVPIVVNDQFFRPRFDYSYWQ